MQHQILANLGVCEHLSLTLDGRTFDVVVVSEIARYEPYRPVFSGALSSLVGSSEVGLTSQSGHRRLAWIVSAPLNFRCLPFLLAAPLGLGSRKQAGRGRESDQRPKQLTILA